MGFRQLAENLWVRDFVFRMMGMSLGRRTTVMRLDDGRLVIHSTAPFSEGDVAEVRSLGEPAFLVEATLFHDTFAAEGRRAFPEILYFAPDTSRPWAEGGRNFSDWAVDVAREVEIREIEGMPSAKEHLFYHRASGTLVLCDLLFNIGPGADFWTRFMMGWVNRAYGRPSVSRLYRSMIRDRDAFRRSMGAVLEQWDFQRVVVGHGTIIETEGKAVLKDALRHAGLSSD